MSRIRFGLILPIYLAASSVYAYSFDDFDTDGDGVISGTEAASNYGLSEQWLELDTDVDGVLSVEEFSAYTPPAGTEQQEEIPQEQPDPLDPLDNIESIDPVDPVDPTNPATEIGQ